MGVLLHNSRVQGVALPLLLSKQKLLSVNMISVVREQIAFMFAVVIIGIIMNATPVHTVHVVKA